MPGVHVRLNLLREMLVTGESSEREMLVTGESSERDASDARRSPTHTGGCCVDSLVGAMGSAAESLMFIRYLKHSIAPPPVPQFSNDIGLNISNHCRH
jgi:hypothetical protein